MIAVFCVPEPNLYFYASVTNQSLWDISTRWTEPRYSKHSQYKRMFGAREEQNAKRRGREQAWVNAWCILPCLLAAAPELRTRMQFRSTASFTYLSFGWPTYYITYSAPHWELVLCLHPSLPLNMAKVETIVFLSLVLDLFGASIWICLSKRSNALTGFSLPQHSPYPYLYFQE